jgi:hypothetical protein
MARHLMPGFLLLKNRVRPSADRHGRGTPWVKMAAGRGVGWIGNISRHLETSFPGRWVRNGHCCQQRFGIGMERFLIKRLTVRKFDDPAEVHDRNPVAKVVYQMKIVRDKKVREVKLFPEIDKKVDYLSLNGNIQGGDGLVSDHQLRVET